MPAVRTRCPPIFAVLLVLTACAEMPLPRPPALPSLAPTSAPALGDPPTTSALLADPDPASPVDPPPLAEPLAPATRSFAVVALPKVSPLVAVDGRGPGDVWLLGEGGEVVRWDGTRAARKASPRCATRTLQTIAGTARYEVYEPRYLHLAVTPSEVILGGVKVVYGFRGGTTLTMESRSRDGVRWSCDEASGVGASLPFFAGGALLRMDALHNGGLSADGRPLPLPSGAQVFEPLLAGRSDRDIWLGSRRFAPIVHYDGITWTRSSPGLGYVADLWADDTGTAWAVGTRAEAKTDADPAGDVAVRWDRGARTWVPLPVPAGFRARVVRGAGSRDVWFFGDEAFYQWDGASLRRAEPALASVRAAWADAGGDLWVVGADAKKRGAAARSPRGGAR